MKTMLRTRKLQELNWMEFKRLVPKKTEVVLLPVGTIEAHGVTGLGTDNQIPLSIAERIAEPVNALIAPTIHYGITRRLLPYPGSLTVLPEAFEQYVTEVAASLADAGFKRVVFLNGHSGNTEALKNISVRLYRDKKAYSMVIDWWTLCDEEVRRVYGHAGGHAGTDETALVQVDHPEQVRRRDYKKEMAFVDRPGLAALPFPGSILIYEKDEGLPDFDPAKAGQLMTAVCSKVEKIILDVFRRWQAVG
jgi:creatinine amidohydrolase